MTILPDAWCGIHFEELAAIHTRERGQVRVQAYCRACRRDRYAAKHPRQRLNASTPRCRRGHLKTPWTWRNYDGRHRCLTCQSDRDKAKRRERAA